MGREKETRKSQYHLDALCTIFSFSHANRCAEAHLKDEQDPSTTAENRETPRKSGGSAFPTEPLGPRVSFSPTPHGGERQTVPRLRQGAWGWDLPRDHSCSAAPLQPGAKAGGIQTPNTGEVEWQGVRAPGTGTPQLLHSLAGLAPLLLNASPNFPLALLPAGAHPSEEPQPDPQAFSNNSVVHLYIKRKTPARKRCLWTETRPAPSPPQAGAAKTTPSV